MAGPYKSLEELDAALASKEPAQPYKSIGDLDAAITQSDANDETRLGFSAKQSLTSKPDQYIKARDLGGQFGIPPDVAERNLPEVEYRNKLDALIGTMRSSPALGTLMQDPGYLKRTHDDIDALAQIEFQTKGFRAASEFQRKALDAEIQDLFDKAWTGAKIEADIERNRQRTVLDYVGQGGSALASSLWSANSGLWGLGRAAADVVGTVLPDEAAKELTGFFTRYQQATGKTAQQMLGDPNQQGFVERSIYSGLQSLGQNLLTLPAALIPGVGPGVTLGPMTAMTGGTEYGKARDKGVAIPQALIYGASQMAIEYATEVMPVTKFLGDIKAGTPFASMLMKQVAYEVPGEQVATLLQDLNEWAVINPAKPFAAYLEERPSAAAQTLIATIVGVGGQATTVKGVETLVGAVTGQDQPFSDPLVRRAQAAQRTLEAESTITQLVDTAGQSLSISRDPSAVQELIDQADEDGQSEVFINARQFANVFNQSPVETAAALGVDATALNDALASNTDLVVPLSTFATAVARDQALRPIIEHTRVDPGDMSPSEARLWQSQQGDQFKAEAEAVLAKRQADETFKAEVQQVHDNLLGQLNQAGRWAPQVNQKYAAMVRDFYVTMADRAGMTVTEMAAKYPLRVVAEGQGALEQGPAMESEDSATEAKVGAGGTAFKSVAAAMDEYREMQPIDKYSHEQQIAYAEAEIRKDYMLGNRGGTEFFDQMQEEDSARFFDDDGDLTDDGNKRYVELQGAAVEKEALDQVGDPQKRTVDFSLPEDAAKFLVWYFTGETPRVVNGSGKSQSKYITVPIDGKEASVRVADHELPIEYQEASEARGDASELELSLYDVDPSDVRDDGRSMSRGISEDEAMRRIEDFISMVESKSGTAFKAVDTESAEFKAWFGDSKAVDSEGKPLVVYHGAAKGGYVDTTDIEAFDPDRTGDRWNADSRGFFFTNDKRIANYYATSDRDSSYDGSRKGESEGAVYPVYVSLQNPLKIVIPKSEDVVSYWDNNEASIQERATAGGHDGVILIDKSQTVDGNPAQTVVAFEPTQIKSATGNRGTFDPANPNILMQGDDAPRASFDPSTNTIALLEGADFSSFLHESGHFFLEVMADLASRPDAPASIRKDFETALAWMGVPFDPIGGRSGAAGDMGGTLEQGPVDPDAVYREMAADEEIVAALETYMVVGDPPEGPLNDKLVAYMRRLPPVPADSYLTFYRNQPSWAKAWPRGWASWTTNEDQTRFFGGRDFEVLKRKGAQGINLTRLGEMRTELTGEFHQYGSQAEWLLLNESVALFQSNEQTEPGAPTSPLGRTAAETWAMMSLDEKRPYHEKWARGYEAYLFEGRSPSVEMQGIFQRFSQWMKQVYTSLKALNVELTDDVRGVFDRMIASEDAIKTAEAVRNFAPIFQTAEQLAELYGATPPPAKGMVRYYHGGDPSDVTGSLWFTSDLNDAIGWAGRSQGMQVWYVDVSESDPLRGGDQEFGVIPPSRVEFPAEIAARRQVFSEGQNIAEEWEAYQAEGRESTDTAVDELQTRSIRDMRWQANAKAKKIKELQATAKELRAEVKIDVRREVLSQPLYRAWQFLTGKNPDQIAKIKEAKSDPNKVDPTKDTLLTAIAKLGGIDLDQAVSEWGLDPADANAKADNAVGGKRKVVRKEGGRKLDAMAEALAQYGYLETDATGKWDNRQFEEMFFDALRGGEYFSQYGEEAMIAAATRNAQGDPDAGITLENTPAGKLNTEMLKGMYGETDTAPWRLLSALRMTSPDGLAPDQVADLFGFTSGDELVRRLAVAEDPRTVIEARTDQRMLEEFGDMATPGGIERAAERAIHNEVRARMLTRELNALRKAVGQGKVVLKAARQHAEAWLARQTVRNAIRHAQHVAAEGRSARAAEEALKAGDTEAAAIHKRDQLLNNQIARGALRAADEVRIAIKYLKKFEKEGTRKAIDPEYRDQIDQLLERFDLRQVSGKTLEKRASLAAWLKAQEEQGLDPVIDAALVEEAQRQHYSTLTLEEFRGLVDSIKSIEHLGRLKNHLLTAKDKRAFDAVKAELSGSIARNANRDVKTANAITPLEKGAKILRNFSAMHRKFASIVREMDGGKDGGPMWEYLVRTMNEAGDREVTLRGEMSEKFADLFDGIKGIKLNEKVFVPDLRISLRREELLAIALNSGNDGNVQRLLDGGINESLQAITGRQLMGVLNQITDKEWDFVEGVWQMIEDNRPAIAAQEKALTGVEPKWVNPTPFTLSSGRVIRGGYYPAKYNADMSTRSNELEAVTDLRQQMQGAAGRAATRKSYTEQRSKEVTGRPLRLDLGVISQHINEVTHRLAWQAWLIDARRILNATEIDRAIRDHYGPEILAQMKKQLADIAAGDNGPTDALDKVMNHIRNGTTIAGMGWNIMTSLMQPIGLTQSVERVGATWIAKGLGQYLAGNPFKVTADVHERSEFMANRAKTINREINDVLNRIRADKMSRVEASYFYLIQKFQQMVDVPTWLGAYEKAIADGNADDRAVALADQAVIDSQGGGQLKDLSAIQRGGSGQKLFTNFYSFFNTTYNRAVENARATDFSNPMQVGKLAANYLLLFTLPAVWGWALKEALRGDDDDEDAKKIAKRLAMEQLNYLLGTMVLVREIGSAISGFSGYQGPAGTRFFAELGKLIKQTEQGEVDMALVKAAANTVGIAAHLPSGQIMKSVEGTVAVMDGKAGPQAVLVGPPIKN